MTYSDYLIANKEKCERLAKRLMQNWREDDVEDVLHNVWLRLRDKKVADNVGAYVSTSIRNECYRNTNKVHKDSGRETLWEESRSVVFDATALHDVYDIMSRVNLPKQQKKLVWLFLEGLNFTEMGKELKVTETAARTNFYNAVKKLRKFAV